MKKKGLIIASLLILVLSVFFMGCPPEDKGNAWDVSDGAKTALSALGVNNLPTPGAGTFIPHATGKQSGKDYVILGWSGCDGTNFTAYKTKLDGALANISRTLISTLADDYEVDKDGYSVLSIFTTADSSLGEFSAPKDSIVVQVTAK